MRLRLLWRRLSVSAPRMAVRTHWPLPLRVGVLLLSMAVFGMAVWWVARQANDAAPVADSGLAAEQAQHLAEQAALLKEAQEQIEQLQGQIKLEKATQAELAKLVSGLENDNARLKEDLAFYEGYIPADTPGGISVRRAQFQKDAVAGQWRYKALVIQGPDSPEVNIQMQMIIKGTRAGHAASWVYPQDMGDVADPPAPIRLKRFMRYQGSVALPLDTDVDSVEFRVLEKNNVRAHTVISVK